MDDAYLVADSPNGIQGCLDITSNYVKRYNIESDTNTKIVVNGSKINIDSFKVAGLWTLNDERIKVVKDDDHLGLVVSGLHEEQ